MKNFMDKNQLEEGPMVYPNKLFSDIVLWNIQEPCNCLHFFEIYILHYMLIV